MFVVRFLHSFFDFLFFLVGKITKEPTANMRSALECAYRIPKGDKIPRRVNAPKDHQNVAQNKIGYQNRAPCNPNPLWQNDERLLFLKIPHPCPHVEGKDDKAHKNNKGVVFEGGNKIKAQKCRYSSRSAAKRAVDEKTVHQASAKDFAKVCRNLHIKRHQERAQHSRTVQCQKRWMTQLCPHSLTTFLCLIFIVAQNAAFEKRYGKKFIFF